MFFSMNFPLLMILLLMITSTLQVNIQLTITDTTAIACIDIAPGQCCLPPANTPAIHRSGLQPQGLSRNIPTRIQFWHLRVNDLAAVHEGRVESDNCNVVPPYARLWGPGHVDFANPSAVPITGARFIRVPNEPVPEVQTAPPTDEDLAVQGLLGLKTPTQQRAAPGVNIENLFGISGLRGSFPGSRKVRRGVNGAPGVVQGQVFIGKAPISVYANTITSNGINYRSANTSSPNGPYLDANGLSLDLLTVGL